MLSLKKCYRERVDGLSGGKHKDQRGLLRSDGLGFPGCAVVENLPANAGNTGLSPGLGRSHMPWSN